MIKITFTGDNPEFIEALQRKVPNIIVALTNKLNYLMLRLQAKITGEKLSGQVLHQRTGRLIGSVRAIAATQEGQIINAAVEAGGSGAPYAGVQEFGGTREYDIFPVTKKALAFIFNGKQVFATHVLHPPLPPRPFMQPSRDEMVPEITQGMQDAAREGLA